MVIVYILISAVAMILAVILSPFGWMASLFLSPLIASGATLIAGALIGFTRDVKCIRED